MLDSSVVRRTSDSTGFSMDSMFGSVGLDVSRFLAVVADLGFPELASASLIVRRSGRTSSPVVRSVGRTLYYVGFFYRVFGKRLSSNCFSQDCTRDFSCRSIAHSCNESFPKRRGDCS